MARKPMGWRKEPARHALAAHGIKTSNVGHKFAILEGKRGSVEEITTIIRDGKQHKADYPEEAMRAYFNQFKEPWKKGSLEFYRYGDKEYQIWTSPDGTKKAILAANPLYSDSDGEFTTMSTDLVIRHLTDVAEEVARHGDFAKLMPTYGMRNQQQMMSELTEHRGLTERQVYERVDAEHIRRKK